MGQIAIAFGLLLMLALFWRALNPGTPLIRGDIMRGPGHVMTPPYMFHQVDANTVIHLP
jgi:hypothetical protein